MDFEPRLANALANAAMGWYTNSLTNAQLVHEVERLLHRHERDDLRLPADIADEILRRHGRESAAT